MPKSPFGLLCLASVLACTRHQDDQKTLPAVRVQTVMQAASETGIRYSASVLAAAKVDVAFRVGGYVEDIAQVKVAGGKTRLIQEGDPVTKDMILVRLRQNDFAQKLTEARASLAEARAAREQAKLDDARTQTLLASKTASAAEADSTRIKLDVAKARFAAAEAKVAEATTAVSDSNLKSPLDGIVLQRSVEVGTLASPGMPAFVVADTQTVKVVFGVPDTALDRLTIGSDQSVTTEAYAGRTFTGKITRIAPYADPKSRVFEVEISIANADHALKVGMVASLLLSSSAAPVSAALPLSAILRSPKDQNGFAVLVVDDKVSPPVAHMRDVKLGDFLGNLIPVLSGIEATEKVVVQGASFVVDGEAVHILAESSAPGGQP